MMHPLKERWNNVNWNAPCTCAIPCYIFLLFYFSCLITSNCSASEKSIRYSAEAARLPVGSDIAAMGDAGVALSGRASSTCWNPSAAALVNCFTLSAEGADLYRHMSQHGSFTASTPLKNQTGIAVNYQPFYSGVIEMYDTIPVASGYNGLTRHDPVGHFVNYHHLIGISLAKRVGLSLPRLSGTALKLPVDIAYGFSLKTYIQYMNPGKKAYLGLGYNADIGVIARLGVDYNLESHTVSRIVQIGAALREVLPTEIVWVYANNDNWEYAPDGYREPFTYAQYYGISYSDHSLDMPFDWTISLSLHKEYTVTYHGGVEVSFFDKGFFRVGISHKIPVFGAGFRYKQFFIDYAFRCDAVAVSYARITAGVELYRKSTL